MQTQRIRGPWRQPPGHDVDPKVVGLGAPASVRIAFELSEIPALLDAIGDELARYGCGSRINGRALDADAGVNPADWRYHASELHRMLGDIEPALQARYAFDRVEVLWPTVMAHGVVHGAVTHARRRAAEGALGEALDVAQRTVEAFDAVDGGGLIDVCL